MGRDTGKLPVRVQRQLERALATPTSGRVYRRLLAMRFLADGDSPRQAAARLGVTERSIYGWRRRCGPEQDPWQLWERPHTGRPSLCTPQVSERLDWLLAGKPRDRLGGPAVLWTLPLLQAALLRYEEAPLSLSTLRRCLRRQQGVWKRAKPVLPADPAREKKTPDSLASRQVAC